MLFSPSPKRRRLQLRISERRLLLMAGDALAVVAAVLIALRIWAFVARYPFTLDFVLPQSHWFVILVGLWLLLASANDFYDLRTAARRMATLQRLLWITFQMLVIYLLVFFLSPPGSLPRLFILYFGVASFVLIGIWRLLNPALLVEGQESRVERVEDAHEESAVDFGRFNARHRPRSDRGFAPSLSTLPRAPRPVNRKRSLAGRFGASRTPRRGP